MKVSRRWTSWFLLASLAAVVASGLVGCGEEEVVDPYQYTSLNAIMRGAVKDTTRTHLENEAGEKVEHHLFAFEIEAPTFEYVRGDVGIVRSGNMLHFFVARDLENLYPRLDGALLGVRQTFSPQPTHVVLERIKRDGQIVAEDLERPKGYVLPRMLRAGAVDITEPGKNLGEANWKDRKTLESLLPEDETGDLLRFQTGIDTIAWVPRHDLPDSVRMNPTEDDMAFYAVLPMGSFEIVDLAPGADYMLHLLIDRDLPLVGSVSPVSWVEAYADRKTEHEIIGHVVGGLRVNWFKYANGFVEGYRAEF
jgi:hypothetical protein